MKVARRDSLLKLVFDEHGMLKRQRCRFQTGLMMKPRRKQPAGCWACLRIGGVRRFSTWVQTSSRIAAIIQWPGFGSIA